MKAALGAVFRIKSEGRAAFWVNGNPAGESAAKGETSAGRSMPSLELDFPHVKTPKAWPSAFYSALAGQQARSD
jgi:hypothetical protein